MTERTGEKRGVGVAERARERLERIGEGVSTLLLMGLALMAAFAWGFLELTDEVLEGSTHELDTRILLLLRTPGDTADPLGPPWVEELLRDVTALGGVGVLTFLTVATAGLLWLRGHPRTTAFLLASVGIGIALSQSLKSLFDRPRPELVPHGSEVYTASFPSGHSLMATVVYLTLAVLLIRVFHKPAIRAYLMMLAVIVVLAIGASRVYLGVHWPTDVLAGWLLGASWALLCALTARWLSRRGRLRDARDGLSDRVDH